MVDLNWLDDLNEVEAAVLRELPSTLKTFVTEYLLNIVGQTFQSAAWTG